MASRNLQRADEVCDAVDNDCNGRVDDVDEDCPDPGMAMRWLRVFIDPKAASR